MRSTERSEDLRGSLDLALDLPATAEDVAALEALRHGAPDAASVWIWSQQVSSLCQSPPRRATSEGWEPFSL